MKRTIAKKRITITATCAPSPYSEICKTLEDNGYMINRVLDEQNRKAGEIKMEKMEKITKGSLVNIFIKLLNWSLHDPTRWEVGTLSDVNTKKEWTLEVYGRIHLHALTILAEQLSMTYNVEIEIILESEEPKYVHLCDFP